ncbi:hypothetical protein WJX82_007479 [Trebouxia sp. C0006]
MNAEKLDLLSDKVALRIQHQSGKFCADSVPSVEKLSKVVPAVSFSDAIYDWAGGDNRGAHAYTTTEGGLHFPTVQLVACWRQDSVPVE